MKYKSFEQSRIEMIKKSNFSIPLHLYRCAECDYKPFATWYAPIYEEYPAYCPNCGRDGTVEYIGESQSLVDEVKRWETKYHVDMNNYRNQVQTWQEQHDKQILSLQQQAERYKAALEEIKDEEWRLAGEFSTIYLAAYSALYHEEKE